MTEGLSRFVELEGGFNVRDLGGYAAGPGYVVRRGLVFRSASLSGLTDADRACLATLNIRLVVDLRSTVERTQQPSRLATETWARDYDNSGADLISALRTPHTTASIAKRIMTETYRELLDEQADSFAELFRRIAQGDMPVLFHCALGKDRTGIAAALLLALVGVSRDNITEDYLHTRSTTERSMTDARVALAQNGISEIDAAVLLPVFEADPSYLDAAFDEIERRFGTVETYAYRQLGLTSADIGMIRTRLLGFEG